MVKKLMVLLVLVGVLISGCAQQNDNPQKQDVKEYNSTEVFNTTRVIFIDIEKYVDNESVVFPETLEIYNYSWTFNEDSWVTQLLKEYAGGNYTLRLLDKDNIKYYEYQFHLSNLPQTMFWDGVDGGGFKVFDFAPTTIVIPHNDFFSNVKILLNNKTIKEYSSKDVSYAKMN